MRMLIASSLAFHACATTTGVPEQRTTKSHERRCVMEQPSSRTVSLEEISGAKDTRHDSKEDTQPIPGFSWRALQTARVIEVLPLLQQVAQLEEKLDRPRGETREAMLEARQQILGRIMLAILEVQGASALVNCERERTLEQADRLSEAEAARVRQQSLAAILIGGVGAIVSGGFGLVTTATGNTGSNVASIVAGAIASFFGAEALYPSTIQHFDTTPNLLGDVWQGRSSTSLFPESVREFLDQPMKEQPDGETFREELISNWQQEGQLGTPGTENSRKRKQLMFSEGGEYDVPALRARAHMLDALFSTITLMNEHLEELIREVMIHGSRSTPR
jgi:hypothetical protein